MNVLQMLPDQAPHDFAYQYGADAIFGGESLLHGALTDAMSNSEHLLRGEAGIWTLFAVLKRFRVQMRPVAIASSQPVRPQARVMSVAPRLPLRMSPGAIPSPSGIPALSVPVSIVLRLRALEQVARARARRVVAVMQRPHPREQWPLELELQCQAVSPPRLSSDCQASVTTSHKIASPEPAGSELGPMWWHGPELVDMRPEALDVGRMHCSESTT